MTTMQADVMMIEDNADDLELAQLALRKSNPDLRVHVVRDGVEALAYLHGTGAPGEPPRPQPRLILLDLKMPRIDGLELLTRLRAHAATARVPIVMLTASRLRDDVEACYAQGANSYVVKPSSFARFILAMERIVTYWLQVNQPSDAR